MTDSILSTQQLAVICALSNGASMTEAAAEAGVHRNTIANWRRNTLAFQNGLANAQYDRALYFREKMEEQAGRAVEAIQQILTDPQAPASVRLRAALAVMQVASTPPEPKKRTELEIKKVVVQENPPEVHNSAQPPSQPTHETLVPDGCRVNSRSFRKEREESPVSTGQRAG